MKHISLLFVLFMMIFSQPSCGKSKKAHIEYAVDIDGDQAVYCVGYRDTSGGVLRFLQSSGSKWEVEKEFDLGSIDNDYRYSISIALAEKTAVVGADGKQGKSGAVLVFRKKDGEWQFVQKMTAPDPQPDDLYGYAVDISGERLIVGAPGIQEQKGGAYIYEIIHNECTVSKQIIGPDISKPNRVQHGFGSSVFIAEDIALVGGSEIEHKEYKVPIDDSEEKFYPEGIAIVYCYREGAWEKISELHRDLMKDKLFFSGFGRLLSSHNSQILVGAFMEIHIFEKDQKKGWHKKQTLTPDLFPEDWPEMRPEWAGIYGDQIFAFWGTEIPRFYRYTKINGKWESKNYYECDIPYDDNWSETWRAYLVCASDGTRVIMAASDEPDPRDPKPVGEMKLLRIENKKLVEEYASRYKED